MIDINPKFNRQLRQTGTARGPEDSGQPASSSSIKGEYNEQTGVVSFVKAPESIAAILKSSGVLEIFNIKPSDKVGFKLEEGKELASYAGMLKPEYVAGINSIPGLPAKTKVMSAFINKNGRDIYVASILIMPDGRNGMVNNPVLNSIQGTLFPLMQEADAVSSPVRSAATRVKTPDGTRDGMRFYKLQDLGDEYQPLLDYMHHFQGTSSTTAIDAYLAINELKANKLPAALRRNLELEEAVRSGIVNITDQTPITAIFLSSSVDNSVAPVLLFTHTNPPIGSATEDFIAFIDGQSSITLENAAELVRSLYNSYVAS